MEQGEDDGCGGKTEGDVVSQGVELFAYGGGNSEQTSRKPFPGKALEAACRMQAKKTALTGGLMCLIYLVTGVFFNLAAGLLLLLLAVIAARQKRRPRLLFQ